MAILCGDGEDPPLAKRGPLGGDFRSGRRLIGLTSSEVGDPYEGLERGRQRSL